MEPEKRTPMNVPSSLIHDLPKTDLHCHLDGSLRPATLLELARSQGVTLPSDDPEELKSHLTPPPGGDLVDYLELFDLTLSVLDTEDSLSRVAFELAEDAARENVRYLEVRFAPNLHQKRGLTLEAILDAVLAGLRRAEREYRIRTGVLLCGIRHIDPKVSLRLAELAVAYKGRGVVGFDLAGAEKDWPAKDHLEAFYLIRNENINVTVHAGEAFGAPSIHQAIHYCGAHRIGHGTRLREDPDLLNYVNDHRIGVEVCLTSNLQTGVVGSFEEHPFRDYFNRGLRVSLNTDNRLMSGTSVTQEIMLAIETFSLSLADVRKILIHGFKSAFLPHAEK
ncbi:MAG: adenosine deaminase, partial [Candidatus Eisenbacteria bacterium]|nr:adenosine deaminase [Candidatus Eisenbacteria bacterium]